MVNSLLESSASIHALIQGLSKKTYAKGQDPMAVLSGGAQIHRKPLPELCYACCTLQTGDYAGISEMLKIPHRFLKLSPMPRQVPPMHVHILNDARAHPQQCIQLSSLLVGCLGMLPKQPTTEPTCSARNRAFNQYTRTTNSSQPSSNRSR